MYIFVYYVSSLSIGSLLIGALLIGSNPIGLFSIDSHVRSDIMYLTRQLYKFKNKYAEDVYNCDICGASYNHHTHTANLVVHGFSMSVHSLSARSLSAQSLSAQFLS